MTAGTRCELVKSRACSELLYCRRISLRLKGAVHRSCIGTAILYGSEAWCLKERWEFYKGQNDPL